jgi:hypothetical protein
MTRREWLHKNPPPKAAGSLRELLAQLTAETNQRAQFENNKAAYAQHVAYWNQQASTARAAGDAVTLNHANAQLKDVQEKIAEIDRQLAASAGLLARITELQAELNRAARCSTHNTDLLRHKNRPDDLFFCPAGPHFFLWTKVGTGAQLSPVDLTNTLPGLDEKMEWI